MTKNHKIILGFAAVLALVSLTAVFALNANNGNTCEIGKAKSCCADKVAKPKADLPKAGCGTSSKCAPAACPAPCDAPCKAACGNNCGCCGDCSTEACECTDCLCKGCSKTAGCCCDADACQCCEACCTDGVCTCGDACQCCGCCCTE